MRYYDEYEEIHEKDYGGPAVGGILLGLIEIVWGIGELIFLGVRALYRKIRG